MSGHPDAETYRELMFDLGLGQALYEPGPNGYDHVRVGDVGYVDNGSFKRLFNACFEADDTANQDSTLPESFVPLDPKYRKVSGNRRLDAGIRISHAVRALEATASASAPVVVMPMSAGSEFSFTCNDSRGAMLITTTSALVYDAEKKGAFAKYMKAQAVTLESLIEAEGLGIALSDIILVTECCLTRDWSIMVCRDSEKSASFGFEIGMLDAKLQGAVSRVWCSHMQVPLHQWPPIPPLKISSIGKPEPHDDEVYSDVERADALPPWTQCIFVRGYRVSRRRWHGLKIRAAAEPEELSKDRSPPAPIPAITADRSSDEAIVLDESSEYPEERTNVYKTMFDHIFQHSKAEVAVLHDDVICRIATVSQSLRLGKPVALNAIHEDQWRLDNLADYLKAHAEAHNEDVDEHPGSGTSPRPTEQSDNPRVRDAELWPASLASLGPSVLATLTQGADRLDASIPPPINHPTSLPRDHSGRLVLSIDIGTVYTAVGVRYKGSDARIYRDSVNNWPGHNQMWSQKVPSAVMYDSDGNLLACGAEARSRHLEEPGGDHYYVEHFKMHLHPRRIMRENNLELRALPPNVTITQVYADFMAHLLQHIRRYLQQYLLKDVWTEQSGKAEIIMAHPNYWSYAAQNVMEQAAMNAGLVQRSSLARLHSVEEAEAAVAFFISEWTAVAERFTVGTTFFMCDAGGSTADISTYKVLHPRCGRMRLQEVNMPSCKYAGGVRVDDRFANRLDTILSSIRPPLDDEDLQNARIDGLANFQESAKVEFASPQNDSRIKIGGRRMKSEELSVDQGWMNVRGSEMEGFFLPSVEEILSDLRERYALQRDRPQYILLSGGFGNSAYLQARVAAEFRGHCTAIFGSPNNSKPVVMGALNLLDGEPGSVLVHRRDRSWKTWVTDFRSRFKSLISDDG